MAMRENLVKEDNLIFLPKKKYFSDLDILSIFAFFLGLFSTFEAFKINIKGGNIYPYNLFFLLILSVLIIRTFYLKKFNILYTDKLLKDFLENNFIFLKNSYSLKKLKEEYSKLINN